MENRFHDASVHVEGFLTEGATLTRGAAQMATLHLAARSLADLRAGQFLASSGLPIQMASVVRPVLESLNLVEMFHRDPTAAERWSAGQWQEFMPSRVRNALGMGPDPVYSWLSEMSHPRFAGFQLTTYRIVRDADQEGDPEHARLFIGGLPLELPPVLLATMAPANALCQLSLALGYVPVRPEVAWTWATVARRVTESVLPGYEAIMAALAHHEVGIDVAREMLEAVRGTIATAREMEAIVARERERGGD
jgi:hypothetical protein